MAALVDESQYTTIEEYVQSARDEGGDVFQPDIDLPVGGYYYKPTLITNVSTVSRVVQEEIFGPVAVAMSFRYPYQIITPDFYNLLILELPRKQLHWETIPVMDWEAQFGPIHYQRRWKWQLH